MALWIQILIVTLIGLVVACIQQIIIQRYPKFLEHNSKLDCHEFLSLPLDDIPHYNFFSLPMVCANCKHALGFWASFPFISYWRLKGKCPNCQTPMSRAIFLTPLITVALTLGLFFYQHDDIKILGFLWLYAWIGLPLLIIDLLEDFLPDFLTYSLLWLGLIASTYGYFVSSDSSIYGAAIGFIAFYGLAYLISFLRGKWGAGFGDFKLLAALGAWVGLAHLPQLILIMTGIFISYMLFFFRLTAAFFTKSLPLGPAMIIAGAIVLLRLVSGIS